MDLKKIRAVFATLGALVFPGLGHLLLGKWIRALLFAFAILLLFGLGILLEGKLYYVDLSQPILNLPFLATASTGLPYLFARSWGYGAGNLQNQSFDYGTTFVVVAGLLNLLVTLNAYDISVGRKK
ncbi:MAG: hypothetical protein DMG06_08420 [Acidobacteria bacterium]|nr:MAG: hypothetical protein DMG06_08420 [Acidobacteriota bacterium]